MSTRANIEQIILLLPLLYNIPEVIQCRDGMPMSGCIYLFVYPPLLTIRGSAVFCPDKLCLCVRCVRLSHPREGGPETANSEARLFELGA